jgi:hypothetical protein
MSVEEDKKQKITQFFTGFLISYVLTGLFLCSLFIPNEIKPIYGLTALGILGCVFVVVWLKEIHYLKMGMLTPLSGPVFIRTENKEDSLYDPYTDFPIKKKTHIIIGVFLSIGLLVLYLPSIGLGYLLTYSLGGSFFFLLLVSTFMIFVFLGLWKFFTKENLKYISKGMLPSFVIGMILLLLPYFIYKFFPELFYTPHTPEGPPLGPN